MKTLKYIFAFALPILAMATMNSCSEDEASYSAAQPMSGAQVFFHSDNAASIDLAADGTSFTVSVSRHDTVAPMEIPLTTVVDETLSNLITVPESVSFEAGKATATIEVLYDGAALLEKIGYAAYKPVSIAIADEANSTPYGITEYAFTIGFPEPWSEWEMVGTCTYYLSGYWSGSHTELPLYYREYLLNDVDAQFALEGVANSMNLTIDYNRQTGACSVDVHQAAISDSYGPVFVSDMPHYTLQPGLSYEGYPCTYDAETGTFSLYLIYFVDEALGSSASGYFGNGVETIQRDGFELPDYSVAVEYMGVFANAQGENSAVANVELGADVDSARVAFTNGDVNATLEGLLAGSVEYQVVKENGFVQFPVSVTGSYSIVAVSYAAGEAVEASSVNFDVVVGGGSIYDMLQGAPIEDYTGQWVFPNSYKGETYYSLGNITTVEDDGVTYLLCTGFADAASLGYTDDSFLMVYDAETGLVTLPMQSVPDFTYNGLAYPMLLALSNSEESTVFGGSLIGGFVDGKITFLNAEDNQYTADSFVFYSEDLGLVSYFNALEWTRYVEDEGSEAPAKKASRAIRKDVTFKAYKKPIIVNNTELKTL